MYQLRKYYWHPLPYLVASILTAFYWCLPEIAQAIVKQPNYRHYAHHDAGLITTYIQKLLVFPFGDLLSFGPRAFFVFPYWVLLIVLLRAFYIHTQKFWKKAGPVIAGLFILLWLFPNVLLYLEGSQASQSTGRVASGRIVNSKRMHFDGNNFTTYSFICYLAGRTFVHEKVRQVMIDAYAVCEETCLNRTFVVGEIGLRKGGRFLPHRTHQNGLSVDFMTPVLKNGKVYRSHHLFNLWGYTMEFDEKGKRGDLTIDYENMARHLLELKRAAKANGISIQKVIFDPVLQPYLMQTTVADEIKTLPFTKKRVIIRHDDHYHIDFGVDQ